jgi:hypothetical protein
MSNIYKVGTTHLKDTKPSDKHEYYQFIHPCEMDKPQYSYRFMSVIKRGVLYNSMPFAKLKDCNSALAEFIENNN